ncbi:MAG: UDP-N-acetylmuramoyl-L-alanine--D-glutamate ligase [Gemmatimonadota bacterium]
MLFDQWKESTREVAVLGLGRSGIAAARLLLSRGIKIYASEMDSGPELEKRTAPLGRAGASVQLGGHDLMRIKRAQAIVVSPGIAPEAPPLEVARKAGLPIHSEIDVGFLALEKTRVIAVTGTNGKTTTTALIAHLLTAAGYRATSAGNIGTPLCQAAMEPEPYDWLAVEVSSFQLHDSAHFAPAIGVLTNLAPDHLDRYRSLDDYYADKARLFLHASDASVWVINGEDPGVVAMAKGRPGAVRKFAVNGKGDGWYDRAKKRLMLGRSILIARNEFPLLGDHNAANALAAALAVQGTGAEIPALAEGLRTFKPLPHRMEPVREVNGVLWVNDSKATNIASTAVALDALDRPFVLLLGGRHKGEPYTGLIPRLEGRCRAVVVFGEASELIEKDLKGKVKIARGGSFEDVMERARKLAKPGEAVLLSPACSSYDMFRNYEVRGDRFRAAVEAM